MTTAATPSILIVEDEPKLASLLKDYLLAENYTVSIIKNGLEVLPAIKDNPPTLVLLDLMLPGKGGLDICREVRTFSQLPIIMITARVEEVDRLIGLEIGADDYICKPFSPREVVARVKALLRRIQPIDAKPTDSSIIEQVGFSINEEGFEASINGHLLELTPAEFRLLRLFIQNAGKVFSRERLLSSLYDDNRIVTDRIIDTHIKNLRRKIAQIDSSKEYILSIYGVGYKFDITQ